MRKGAYLLGCNLKWSNLPVSVVGTNNRDYALDTFTSLKQAKKMQKESSLNSLWKKAKIYKLVEVK